MITLEKRFALLSKERPDITQADLSRATGAKPPSVNDWFSGKTKSMKAETAAKAAQLYGCNTQLLDRCRSGRGVRFGVFQGSGKFARTGDAGSAGAEGVGLFGGKVAEQQWAGCLHGLGAPDQQVLPVPEDLLAERCSIWLSRAADPVLDPMLPQEGREFPAHCGAVLAVHQVPSMA